MDRRAFLGTALLSPIGCAATAETKPARLPAFTLTPITGTPRERGRAYGKQFRAAIARFLERELYGAFIGKPSPREAMLRYAGACGKAVRSYAPEVHEEMEGVAEGSDRRLEEVVLLSAHEELWHRGVLPRVEHCTAVAMGPPDTADGHTYVGQTWDWMQSVAGLSTLLHWQRREGPSLLAYAYPGLWCGAGLNSAGIALCWTSAGPQGKSPRVGIPSYALLTHLLYQDSLDAVRREAKRARHAGWFTFVMADGKGNLLNIEASPEEVVVEKERGALARVGYGSRHMTRTPAGARVRHQARCQIMYGHLNGVRGKGDRAWLQKTFADPACKIAVGRSTIDLMVYDTTAREAYLSRGPDYGVQWQKFSFPRADAERR